MARAVVRSSLPLAPVLMRGKLGLVSPDADDMDAILNPGPRGFVVASANDERSPGEPGP